MRKVESSEQTSHQGRVRVSGNLQRNLASVEARGMEHERIACGGEGLFAQCCGTEVPSGKSTDSGAAKRRAGLRENACSGRNSSGVVTITVLKNDMCGCVKKASVWAAVGNIKAVTAQNPGVAVHRSGCRRE
jgi:hypothetical protein